MLTKRGQSTLEYVIILTAIIAVILVIASKVLKEKTQGSLESALNASGSQVEKINFTSTP